VKCTGNMTEKELADQMREARFKGQIMRETLEELRAKSDEEIIRWHLRWVEPLKDEDGNEIRITYKTAMEFCARTNSLEEWDECL
jgi:hypothetical protein